VTVRLLLIVRCDLERKCLTVVEHRAAVEPKTGNAHNGELHGQDIALLAARIVSGRMVNSRHFTIRKGGGVKARRVLCVLVEPQADRILWLHILVLHVLDRDEPRRFTSVRATSRTHPLTCHNRRFQWCRHPSYSSE